MPILPAPPPPLGPLSRSLGAAYRAVDAARIADPGAALRASFLLTQARQRAARGDVAGALADSAAAQAAAMMPLDVSPLAPAAPFELLPRGVTGAAAASVPLAAGARSVPLADRGAALSVDLLVARNEIELVEQLRPSASLERAKRRYRAGLNAYLSGNARKATSEANAAFDAAAAILEEKR